MNVPTSSAVLLMHNAHGGFPIASASGLTRQAAHSLDYDGRTGEYEEKGGCERGLTERDRALAETRSIGDEAARHLDYAARSGAWEAGAEAMADDCSYWGQHGPLTRAEIERDMLACGGCYLKSVISVDRRYAADLGLDSKAAFQELVRANWQDMMAASGAVARPEDAHWYACYHTDAEMSLHVHIATWAADGGIAEGWLPSARATREQKAILYRDAYAPVRTQRNLEQDYYRMLLPRLAAAEMGDQIPEATARRLEAKAERAGVDAVPPERTLDDLAQAEVARRAQDVAKQLDEGRGLKSRNWKLQSDAGKVIDAIRRNSPQFDAALSRYRQLAEMKADMAGLAIAKEAEGAGPGPKSKAAAERASAAREVAAHERDRFVSREMDDVMRRIRSQVIRSADPDERLRSLARESVGEIRHELVTKSLRPERIGLPPEAADRLRKIYQDAARPLLIDGASNADEPMPRERAAEAARIVASSAAAKRAAEAAAARIVGKAKEETTYEKALEAVRAQMEPELARALKWRFDEGHVDPLRMEHDRLGFHEERAIARDLVWQAARTKGLSLGLPRSAGEELANHLAAARETAENGRLSAEGRSHAESAADLIAASPAMRRVVDEALRGAAAQGQGLRAPDRDYVDASVRAAVAQRVASHVAPRQADETQQAGEQETPSGIGLAGLAAMVAATIVRERASEAGPGRVSAKRTAMGEPEEGRTR